MASEIESFIVFDATPQNDECAPPPILYSKSTTGQTEKDLQIEVGIFLALVKFAKFFTIDVPVDYALTDNRETAIMCLVDNIWISVTKKNTGHPNRELLIAILTSCRRLFHLFFKPPTRDEEGRITRKSQRMIQCCFEEIVMGMSKTNLTFIHLFDAYFQLSLPMEISREIELAVEETMGPLSPIHGIVIMHSRSLLFSNFPKSVTKTLAFALQMKFPYLFPRVLMKDEERMYWIIGLSRETNGSINIYAPPVIHEDHMYPLVALKFHKYKIVIALKENSVPTPELLCKIPVIIKPLKSLFNNMRIDTPKRSIHDPFIVIENHKKDMGLSLINQKISDASIPIAEEDIIRAYHFAHNVSNKDSNIGFTGATGNFMYYNNTEDSDHVVLTKTNNSKISDSLEKTKTLKNQIKMQKVKVSIKKHNILL